MKNGIFLPFPPFPPFRIFLLFLLFLTISSSAYSATPTVSSAEAYRVYSENLQNALLVFGECTFEQIKNGHYQPSVDASGQYIAGGDYSSSDYKPPAIGKSILMLWAKCPSELVALTDACTVGGMSQNECSKTIADMTNQQLKNLHK